MSAKVKASNTCAHAPDIDIYLRKRCRCSATAMPNSSGPLAESINPATIKAANEAVKDATSKPSKARGSYRHVDAGTQVKIVQYACEHGNYGAFFHSAGF